MHKRVYKRSRWPFVCGCIWASLLDFFVHMSSKNVFPRVLCIMHPLSRRSNVVLVSNTLGSNDDITIQTSNWRFASNPLVRVPRYGLVKHNTPGHVTRIRLFVGHMQRVQTQIRRRIMRRLTRIFTVCLQYALLKFEKKRKMSPNTPKCKVGTYY